MARIPYPQPENYSEAVQTLMSKLPPLNLFRMLSHSEHLLKPFITLGNTFLMHGQLDAVIREIAILRVGYLSEAVYETTQHENIGRTIGMDETLFNAVRAGAGAEELTPLQTGVIAYVDDLVLNVRASDETFLPVQDALGATATQELTLLTGYYMMVCRFLNTYDIDLEAETVDVGIGTQ